jgi:hypothetical protein
MADDGSGREIDIPSILISKADGDAVKSLMASSPKGVQVQIQKISAKSCVFRLTKVDMML